MWVPMIAGASARITAVTLFSPLELIRTKMQSKKLTYLGKWSLKFKNTLNRIIHKKNRWIVLDSVKYNT